MEKRTKTVLFGRFYPLPQGLPHGRPHRTFGVQFMCTEFTFVLKRVGYDDAAAVVWRQEMVDLMGPRRVRR